MAVQILFRRGTASSWISSNPVLSTGEPGFETDTGKFKIGDGTTAWAALQYATGLDNILDLQDLNNVIITSPTSGQVLKFNGTNWINGTDDVVGEIGTVTSISVNTANGFLGSVINPTTTPSITLSTTVSGILKGNGTSISSAIAGADYQAPITLTTVGSTGSATLVGNTLNIPQYTNTTNLDNLTDVVLTSPSNGQVLKFNGTNWVNGTDDAGTTIASLDDVPGVALTTPSNGQVLKYNGTNWVNDSDNTGSALTSLDDVPGVVLTSPSNGQVLKYNGTNWVNDSDLNTGIGSVALNDVTDVVITTPSTGQVLKFNGTNWVNDTDATGGGGGGGTVTTVSIVTANGFAGSVTNDSTTPAITLTTSISGLLKGNGTALSAAISGTDFQDPIVLTTTGSSGAATLIGNTLNIPQYSVGGGGGGAANLDELTDVVLTTPSTGQVLKFNGTNWINDTDATSTVFSRTTAFQSTTSIADADSENIDITGFKSYVLLKIQTSAAAWVRLYSDDASRTADQSRLEGEDPNPGAGVIAEIITTGAQTILITPGTIGFNNETLPTTAIPARVTNKSGSSTSITVTLTLVQLEV